MRLPHPAKELIRAGALGHVVTIDDRGAPHVTCVWVAIDDPPAGVRMRIAVERVGGNGPWAE